MSRGSQGAERRTQGPVRRTHGARRHLDRRLRRCSSAPCTSFSSALSGRGERACDDRWLIPEASTYARDIDWLFTIIFLTVGFWFLVAQGDLLLAASFRFRRRDGVPGPVHHRRGEGEKRWISIPHALVLVCDVVIIVAAVRCGTTSSRTCRRPTRRCASSAQQWAWTFVHPGPDGQLDTADDITDDQRAARPGWTPSTTSSSSRKDVLHSFSVPVFRLKQDAIPGRVITGWFKPTTTGHVRHPVRRDLRHRPRADAGRRIIIETPEQHAAWVAAQLDHRRRVGDGALVSERAAMSHAPRRTTPITATRTTRSSLRRAATSSPPTTR